MLVSRRRTTPRFRPAGAIRAGVLLAGAAVLEPYRVCAFAVVRRPVGRTSSTRATSWTQALIGFGRGEYLGIGPRARGVPEALLSSGGTQRLHLCRDRGGAWLVRRTGHPGAAGIPHGADVRGSGAALFAGGTGLRVGLLAYGAALLIGIQTIINVGVNTGCAADQGPHAPVRQLRRQQPARVFRRCRAGVARGLRIPTVRSLQPALGSRRATCPRLKTQGLAREPAWRNGRA